MFCAAEAAHAAGGQVFLVRNPSKADTRDILAEEVESSSFTSPSAGLVPAANRTMGRQALSPLMGMEKEKEHVSRALTDEFFLTEIETYFDWSNTKILSTLLA